MRRATEAKPATPAARVISIHALHEESDHHPGIDQRHHRFQSTLSMRRATIDIADGKEIADRISIHALHEESDLGYRAT